jgi:uncharacterized protein YecE (DUF72 family)
VIYLGTSGYSYDDWKRVFYPADLARQEWLAFYAAEFDAVELNFTYYRMPTADQLRRLEAQTPERFYYAVKAHQDITHNRSIDPTPFAQFRAALAPLQHKGKLGAVLLQFPHSFHHTKANVDYLQHCVKQLPELPLVVEFRDGKWLAQRTLGQLGKWGVGFCNVDMPELAGLLPKTAFVTAPTAYVRFHGRNAAKWWKHDHAWERYDYSYSVDELREWVPHLQEMNERAENVFVFANNHWQGQSIAAVRQVKMLLDHQNNDKG